MYGCQQVLISPDIEVKAILEFICSSANKLTNCGVYYARQLYFKTKKYIGKYDLEAEYKLNLHYRVLHSQAAQQVLRSVYESFKSYRGLRAAFTKGKIQDKPSLPGYRKNALAVVSYPKQALKFVDGKIRVPLGNTVKRWFGLDSFMLMMPTNLEFSNIKELRILPRNGCFYAEFVYPIQPVTAELDKSKALSIDHGVSNWLTCVSNTGFSFIIDGNHVKSLNNWYNKLLATLKEGKPHAFWSKQLAAITEKRNRQMRDAVNKAARIVVVRCLKAGIGTVVFGWNQGQKQEVNLGSKANQKFVQIPTARLKERIAQLCQQHGIQFVETEESYTSQASFLDADEIPVFGSKPEGWQSSGQRIKRGLFRTLKGWLVSADVQAAANILKKVMTKLGIDLTGVSMASLTAPQRIQLWSAKKIKRSGASLDRHVASA